MNSGVLTGSVCLSDQVQNVFESLIIFYDLASLNWVGWFDLNSWIEITYNLTGFVRVGWFV